MSLKPGDVVEHFAIVSLLGEGGMGQVYVARDTRLKRDVALKIVRPGEGSSAGGPGSDPAARLLREAQSAAAFEHPNVVTIYEVGAVHNEGAERGCPFIAMELVKGRPLRAFVGDRAVPIAQRTKWLADIARALGAAHRAGLVHRDVKPENVMVRDDGVVKVLDFGIAKRAVTAPISSTTSTEAQLLPSLTAKGVAIGTPYYMAPEQMRREPLDGRADQFSWGVVAYELLAATPPWGREVDALELVSKILSSEPAPLGEGRPEIPAHVAEVVFRAMAKKKSDRFASMDQLVAALEDAAGAFAVTAQAVSAPGFAGRSTGPERPEASTASPPPSARRRWARASGVAVVAAVIAAVAWSASRGRSAAPISAAGPHPEVAAPGAQMSANLEAAAAYEAAMRAFHDASFSVALAEMRRAAELDPMLAAAELRIVLWSSDRLAERSRYQHALALRGRLSAHDQALLDAGEPLFRQIADLADWERRLAAASARFGSSGELLYWVGRARAERGEGIEARQALERVAEVDPTLAAPAWAEIAYVERGDADRMRGAYDKCLSISSTAVDCLAGRLRRHALDGECAGMEADAHAWVAAVPEDADAYGALASALAGRGAPFPAVREAVRAREERLRATEHALGEATDRYQLAMFQGDFDAALEAARALDDAAGVGRRAEQHFHSLLWLGLAGLESSRPKIGADAAAEFLARARAWTPTSPREVALPLFFLSIALHYGGMPRETFRSERDHWLALGDQAWTTGGRAKEDLARSFLWVAAYAVPAQDGELAREALDALPRYLPLPAPSARDASTDLVIGRMYVEAGRPDAAVPYLQAAARNCGVLLETYAIMHARRLLAKVLARGGKALEARTLDESILAQWGSAKPRSVTVDEARAALERR